MAKRFRAAAAIVLLLVFLFCLVQAVPVGVPQSLTVSAVRPDLVARLATTKPGDAGGARAREGLTCEICTRLTELVQRLFDEKKCEDDIVDIARSFCDEFHIEDRNVCAAIVQEFKVGLPPPRPASTHYAASGNTVFECLLVGGVLSL